MRVTFYKAKNMEREDIFGQTDRCMKVNSRMTNVLGLALFFILMARDLKGIGKMAKKVVKAHIFFLIYQHILLYIKVVKNRRSKNGKRI